LTGGLRSFKYESNRGGSVFFAGTEDEAVTKLRSCSEITCTSCLAFLPPCDAVKPWKAASIPAVFPRRLTTKILR